MLRIPCPKCKESSYTSDVESFKSCPFCGFIFSGKYGPDRRIESRTEKEIPLFFSYKGQNFKANTLDLSNKGIGIKIYGKPSITNGEILKLILGECNITAKVMWVERLNDKSLAGLSKLN
ncbi:MAG: PilZ domain-containing protein [Nitrospirae bacterium]|nr:PilZ domain-containing protein [Nitrospirota bacterium]